MRVSFEYDDLLFSLSEVANAVNDSFVADDMKNIVFCATPSGVSLIGATRDITYKKPMDSSVCSVTDFPEGQEKVLFQLKAKELTDFLNSYKSLRMTRVTEVYFEFFENKIKCVVVEEELQDEYAMEEARSYSSQWLFVNMPIKPNVLPFIEIAFPAREEMSQVDVSSVKMHTSNLVPLLQSGTNIFSILQFSEDYVFVQTSTFISFMRNRLIEEKGVFSGISLSYRTATFLDKVVCNVADEFISVARDDSYLYFVSSESSACVRYSTKISEYKPYLEGFDKTNGIVVSRFYLKDVLKRLSLVNDNVDISIEPESCIANFKNSKFSQDVILNNTKGFEDMETVKLRIMPEFLNKAILLDAVASSCVNGNSEFDFVDDDLFLYVVQVGKSYTLYICDKSKVGDSNSWFSVIRLKAH